MKYLLEYDPNYKPSDELIKEMKKYTEETVTKLHHATKLITNKQALNQLKKDCEYVKKAYTKYMQTGSSKHKQELSRSLRKAIKNITKLPVAIKYEGDVLYVSFELSKTFQPTDVEVCVPIYKELKKFNFTPDEFCAIYLHEIGHLIAFNDKIKLSKKNIVALFIGIVSMVITRIVFQKISLKSNDIKQMLHILIQVHIPIFVFGYIHGSSLKGSEVFADRFAIMMGYGEDLASALHKLASAYKIPVVNPKELKNWFKHFLMLSFQYLDEHGQIYDRICYIIDESARGASKALKKEVINIKRMLNCPTNLKSY